MKKKIRRFCSWCIVGSILFITIIPIIYIITHSLKGETLILKVYESVEMTALDRAFVKPFYINLGQYYKVLFRTPEFLRLFWNSLRMVVPIVALQLIIGGLAAYGFSKLKFKGSEILFIIYIIIMLMPFQVTVVPNYIVMNKMQILDKYISIILPGAFGTFAVFFFKQFMEGIDDSFLEQARVEGAKELQILFQIIIPMCKPVIVSTAVLLFVDYWNMVEQPLIFLSSEEKFPLSLYLSNINLNNISIGFACSVIYIILPLLICMYAQSDLMEGLSITSLK